MAQVKVKVWDFVCTNLVELLHIMGYICEE